MAIVGIDLQNEYLEIAENVRLLRSLLPIGKIVVVAETGRPVDAQRLFASMQDACIFKLGSRDALLKVLDLIFLDQRVFVFPKIATTSEADVEFTDAPKSSQSDELSRLGSNGRTLSPRESQVLACLAEGKSNKLIARLYNLSEATVKVHLKAILRKIEVHNRTQAAVWALKHGVRNHFPEHGGLVGRNAA